jgi:tetratricopeptide (TPR) repeat protein
MEVKLMQERLGLRDMKDLSRTKEGTDLLSIYYFRSFQLGQAQFYWYIRTKNKEWLKESTRAFNVVLNAGTSDLPNVSDRYLLTLIQMSVISAKLGNVQDALKFYRRSDLCFQKFKREKKKLKISSDIYRQKLLFAKALIYIDQKCFKTAAELLVQAVEIGTVYLPLDRLLCYDELNAILSSYGVAKEDLPSMNSLRRKGLDNLHLFICVDSTCSIKDLEYTLDSFLDHLPKIVEQGDSVFYSTMNHFAQIYVDRTSKKDLPTIIKQGIEMGLPPQLRANAREPSKIRNVEMVQQGSQPIHSVDIAPTKAHAIHLAVPNVQGKELTRSQELSLEVGDRGSSVNLALPSLDRGSSQVQRTFFDDFAARLDRRDDKISNLVVAIIDPDNYAMVDNLVKIQPTEARRMYLMVMFAKNKNEKSMRDMQKILRERIPNCWITSSQYAFEKFLGSIISPVPQPILLVESPQDE